MSHFVDARFFPGIDASPGWFQMAVDDYLANSIPSGTFQAALRFYTFSPPTITIGTHQTVDTLNLEACAERSWDIARRPTGGRSLLHLQDLSYCLVIAAGSDRFTDLHRVYEGVSRALIETLGSFGIKAAGTGTDHRSSASSHRSSRLCLTYRTRGEVHVEGRKISAAAQRVYKNAVLQHGSILMAGDPSQVAEATDPDTVDIMKIKQFIRETTVTFEMLSRDNVSNSVFAGRMAENISREFCISLVKTELTELDLDVINNSRHRFEIFKSETHRVSCSST